MTEIACPLCGQPANTKEHVIPQWLQTIHNLSNQPLGLHNGTSIRYNQATIPLCQVCNGEKLSLLESKIKNETASAHHYFLWALKIRYFLTLKDLTLQFDRADPSKGKLIYEGAADLGVEFIKNALVNCNNPDFNFFPNPFGSVFTFENPNPKQGFELVDLPNPYWALCITIPDNKILAVLFTDRGLVNESFLHSFKSAENLKTYFQSLFRNSTMQGVRLLTLSLCLRQRRIANIPNAFTLYKNGIKSELPQMIEYKESVDKTFANILGRRIGFPDHLITEMIDQLY